MLVSLLQCPGEPSAKTDPAQSVNSTEALGMQFSKWGHLTLTFESPDGWAPPLIQQVWKLGRGLKSDKLPSLLLLLLAQEWHFRNTDLDQAGASRCFQQRGSN